MSDTTSLLGRISAFRERMERTPALIPGGKPDDPAGLKHQAMKLAASPAWTTDTLQQVSGVRPAEPKTPAKIVGQVRVLLESARGLVAAQRAISEDVFFVRLTTQAETDPLVAFHRGTVSATEAALRLAQALPESAEMQARLCSGLETLLANVKDRLGVTARSLEVRRREWGRVERLTRLLCDVQARRLVSFDSFAAIAEEVIDEARQGQPLRVVHQPVEPVARFAAAHALTVAQVVARLATHDYEWAGRMLEAVSAALLMDVGMLGVSPAVLGKDGPLDAAERSIVERHPLAGASLIREVMPEAGEIADAVATHHERLDGTGYPRGLEGDHVGSLARLLAVADCYAAMAADRPHRAAHDPRAALTDTLLLAEQGQLDRDLAEHLLRLSFHPVGTVVELTDGRAAVVVSTHSGRVNVRATTRPVVAVLADARGVLLPKPEFIDLAGAEYGGVVRALGTTERRTLLAAAHPDLCC